MFVILKVTRFISKRSLVVLCVLVFIAIVNVVKFYTKWTESTQENDRVVRSM